MSFPSKVKKAFKILTLSSISVTFFTTFSLLVNADATSFFNDLFDTGEKGITFTAFEGQLAELSAEGYDPALVASDDLREFIVKIVNFALSFLGLIAVIIVIYGGVLYVTAGGEEERTQKGKKAILYATIGLLIVLGSYAFVNTVIRGAKGETETTVGISAEGKRFSGGFNAAAERVRALAVQIFEGYQFLTESTETLRDLQNDAQKDSLNPNALPSKSNVLTFLTVTKSNLKTMESRMQPFSESKAKINEFIREVDRDIDTINRFKSTVYVKPPGADATSIAVCDAGEEEALLVDVGDTDQEICAEGGYTIVYINKLYDNWSSVRGKYTEDSRYNEIIQPIAKNYATDLKRIFGELDEIYTNFENISVIKEGPAKTAFELLKTTHYGFQSPQSGMVATAGSGFLRKIDEWGFSADISAAGSDLMNGLQQQAIIYEELKNIQFVQSVLSGNVIEGSAPLGVLFDTAGSIDPAGGSITTDQIVWDLGGTKDISELFAASAPDVLIGEGVDCTLTTNQPGGEEAVIGSTAKRCIFNRPGTYRAAVKINSREPTRYAPGISILTIKVHPPTTKIELSVNDEPVMHYEGDLLAIDRNTITITLNEAKAGIEFDASATLAEQFKIDYGDGDIEGFLPGGLFEPHKYTEPGKYKIVLEVVNELGVIDKKIFTLEIANLAARINVTPSGKAFVGNPVSLDGSGSKSDLGKIVNYKWTIKPVIPAEMLGTEIAGRIQTDYPPFVEEGSNLTSLTHEFKYAINYDIELEVSDGNNTDTDVISNYKVESQPPIANFEYDIPKETQPGTVHFDGRPSYDPDGEDNFSYEWSISPGTEGNEWKIPDIVEHGLNSPQPIVKFMEKGDYEMTLKVQDQLAVEENDEITKKIKVEKVVDIAWGQDQEVTAIINDTGKAKVTFILISEKGVSYEIDFGDGLEENGNISGAATVTNDYIQAGKYPVKVTVYGEDDDEANIERRFFIGGGVKPIAKGKLFVNGEEIQDLSQPVKASKKDLLEFDAGSSVNADGKPAGIDYSWDFGDTGISSKKKATHVYKELSPIDPGYFMVKLRVTDDDDPTKFDEDEFYLDVVNLAPTFSSVIGVPDAKNKNLVTPVTVNVKVFEAEDPDGEIVKYKWWYFDVNDPDRPLGIQVTQSSNAQLTIGTRGAEGKQFSYGFGLEITDSDNLSSTNIEKIEQGNYSKVTVINGPNELPTARFNVDIPSVLVGDQITLTSSSNDPDGAIVQYIWDIEGDGFYNNEPTDKSSITHIYTEQNKAGYNVRLKVIDDKAGETVSEPIPIYVESLAEPPKAAFVFEVIKGSEGMKIRFNNNSEADDKAGTRIISNKWDFDTASAMPTADSDGDGDKTNDVDSQATGPERLFTVPGTYKVKLTVTDDQGNSDEVINSITIPLANPPVAAFTHEIVDGQVIFTNNSTADTENGAQIVRYIWDFDTTSALKKADSDGDGEKANDKDSSEQSPTHEYEQAGTYKVKLTVEDNQGNIDDVINDVDFTVVAPPQDKPPTDSGGGSQIPAEIKAVWTTAPLKASDNMVHLPGKSGSVKFNFTASQGLISYYIIDKNIYFDTDGDGIKNNDEDFKTVFPGTWTTNFEKDWGRIVSKLTVLDIHGNENSTTIEIKFDAL